jgi:hypothetical protein
MLFLLMVPLLDPWWPFWKKMTLAFRAELMWLQLRKHFDPLDYFVICASHMAVHFFLAFPLWVCLFIGPSTGEESFMNRLA